MTRRKRRNTRNVLDLIGAHLPPNASGTHAAKVESVEAIIAALADSVHGVAFGDMNSRPGQRRIPGPDAIADAIGGSTYGDRIDCAAGVGLRGARIDYFTVVGGVAMKSDHGHAVRLTFRHRFRRWSVWFYNLQVGRDNDRACKEVRALLGARYRRRKPLAVVLCEATGYELPDVGGFEEVRERPGPRANIAVYVEQGRLLSRRWLDQQGTWKRTAHPGMHPPRSFPAAALWLGRLSRTS